VLISIIIVWLSVKVLIDLQLIDLKNNKLPDELQEKETVV